MRIFTLIVLLLTSRVFASALDELPSAASTVPTVELDRYVEGLIAEEIPGAPAIKRSHYTLALFEEAATGEHWYIVDGYYELGGGEILFLDFVYSPVSRKWRAIENYSGLLPGFFMRYLLQADEICNPYQRHMIGILQGYAPHGLDAFLATYQEKFGAKPNFSMTSWGWLTVYDNSIALQEATYIAAMPDLEIIPSGRAPSDEAIKKTYIPVGDSCVSGAGAPSGARPGRG